MNTTQLENAAEIFCRHNFRPGILGAISSYDSYISKKQTMRETNCQNTIDKTQGKRALDTFVNRPLFPIRRKWNTKCKILNNMQYLAVGTCPTQW